MEKYEIFSRQDMPELVKASRELYFDGLMSFEELKFFRNLKSEIL